MSTNSSRKKRSTIYSNLITGTIHGSEYGQEHMVDRLSAEFLTLMHMAKKYSGSIFVETCDECHGLTDSRNTHPELGETFCSQACYDNNRSNRKARAEVVNE